MDTLSRALRRALVPALVAAALGLTLAPAALGPVSSPKNVAGPTVGFDPTTPTTSHAQLGCFTPACPIPGTELTDHGGAVLTHPVVYLVRFSASPTRLVPASGFVPRFFARTGPHGAGIAMAALNGAYARLYAEYMRPGAPYQGATVGGVLTWYDPALARASTINDAALRAEIVRRAADHTLPTIPGFQPIYVLVLRAHQTVSVGHGVTSDTTFCAYHAQAGPNSDPVPYVVLPNESAIPECDMAGPHTTSLDAVGPILSHELAETVTDPYNQGAWYQDTPWAENADLCEAPGAPANAVPGYYDGVSYPLTPLYSDVAHACVGGPVATSLVSTLSGSTLSVLAVSTSGAVQDQPITVTDGTTVLSATTNNLGQATLSLPASMTGSLVVTYAGAGPLEPCTEFVNPAGVATTLTPSSVAPTLHATTAVNGGAIDVTATRGGAPLGDVAVELVAVSRTVLATAVTNAQGQAVLPVGLDVPAGLALSVVYTGSPAGPAASVPVTVPSPITIGVNAPASAPAQSHATVTVTLSPGLGHVLVAVQSAGVPVASAYTSASGQATLSVTVAPGANTFTATLALGSLAESTTFTVDGVS